MFGVRLLDHNVYSCFSVTWPKDELCRFTATCPPDCDTRDAKASWSGSGFWLKANAYPVFLELLVCWGPHRRSGVRPCCPLAWANTHFPRLFPPGGRSAEPVDRNETQVSKAGRRTSFEAGVGGLEARRQLAGPASEWVSTQPGFETRGPLKWRRNFPAGIDSSLETIKTSNLPPR